jgi:hypothetical protein
MSSLGQLVRRTADERKGKICAHKQSYLRKTNSLAEHEIVSPVEWHVTRKDLA